MADYDNRNRGALWGNQDKKQDSHPDFRGSLNIDGVEYWVDAWKRKPDANPKSPALSFTIKPKEATSVQAPSASRDAFADMDDDIAF